MKTINFAALIITHGRPNSIFTDATLRRQGYTGEIFYVVDDEDETGADYVKKYGTENVLFFCKKEYADKIDEGDNFDNRRTTTHARNAVFDLAKKINCINFIVLDDDYTYFNFRIYDINGKAGSIKDLDSIFNILLGFYTTNSCKTICMSQGGDWIGGSENQLKDRPLTRKAMNSFICSNNKPIEFFSRLNEDVNTYLVNGNRGDLYFTCNLISLTQKTTQKTAGGMTEAYLEYGTYVKSFYSVMYCPSFVKVGIMHTTNKRLHHTVSWDYAVPKILNESLKK